MILKGHWRDIEQDGDDNATRQSRLTLCIIID